MIRKIFILVLIIIAVLLFFSFVKKIKQKQDIPVSTPPFVSTGTSTPTPVPSLTLGSGDYDFSLAHGGLTRKYKAHIPTIYNNANKTPVVIYIHGGGGNSEGSKNDGLYPYSDKYGFILLSPAGTGVLRDKLLVWNLGPYLINGNIQTHPNYASEHNIDDVVFLSKMIDEAKTNFNVDENRIYVTGISQGGMMSYRLACELSDKIAAIAPVAPPAVPMNCIPSKQVSLMHIHGTADPCAPFLGGMSGGCLGTQPEPFQSAQEMVNRWLSINKCSSDSVAVYQKGNATCKSYNACADNSEVEFCTVEGMGHVWLSGWQYLPVNKIGPVSYDISFDQIWEFFKKHQLQ